jgi:hypothetical protein
MYYDIHKCIVDTTMSGRDLGLEISGGPGVADLEARQAGPSQARTSALSGEPGQASKSATVRLGPKLAPAWARSSLMEHHPQRKMRNRNGRAQPKTKQRRTEGTGNRRRQDSTRESRRYCLRCARRLRGYIC